MEFGVKIGRLWNGYIDYLKVSCGNIRLYAYNILRGIPVPGTPAWTTLLAKSIVKPQMS
jgi:hypothetical protein